MNNPIFASGTSKDDVQNINTREGRRMLFHKRLDELMKPQTEGGKGLTLDDAMFEMRTGGNADDDALLEAMGEKPSHFRTEKLRQEKWKSDMDQLAQENANATKTAPEVAAARARNVAFNARIDELTRKGFSVDQAVAQMRANPQDAALLAAMDGPMIA